MRARRDRDEAVKFAASGFAKDFVGSLDNLRRAIESFPSDSLAILLSERCSGLEATERALLDTFERYGITRLDPVANRSIPTATTPSSLPKTQTGRPAPLSKCCSRATSIMTGFSAQLKSTLQGVDSGLPEIALVSRRWSTSP